MKLPCYVCGTCLQMSLWRLAEPWNRVAAAPGRLRHGPSRTRLLRSSFQGGVAAGRSADSRIIIEPA